MRRDHRKPHETFGRFLIRRWYRQQSVGLGNVRCGHRLRGHQTGEHLVGCCYSAFTIIIDPQCLASLPEKHGLNGVSEALKHGLGQSVGLVELSAGALGDFGSVELSDVDHMEVQAFRCDQEPESTTTAQN